MLLPILAGSDHEPRSLVNLAARRRRAELLASSHVVALAAYVERLRARPDVYVPDFAPLDGGVGARILFLFEKPAPKTDPDNGGSGFISRNNNDPTAEASCRFMIEAGLRRRDVAIWNAIPWWNRTRSDRGREDRGAK